MVPLLYRRSRSVMQQSLTWLASCRGTMTVGEPWFRLVGMRRKSRVGVLSAVQKMLIIRLDDIGDMVLTTPFIRELRRSVPKAWITLVVKPSAYDLVRHCPYLDEVLAYDPGPLGYGPSLRRTWQAVQFAARFLWTRRFDLAVIPRWDADLYYATFVTYWSGAPWRVGYSEQVIKHKQTMNKGYDSFLTHVLLDTVVKHEVERNLDILRFIGGHVQDESLELWPLEADVEQARAILPAGRDQFADLIVAIGPGAGAPSRQWSLVNFLNLGEWLQEEYQARIVIVGGESERSLGEELKKGLGEWAINATGRTSLRELGVLLKSCHLYVGNDSGPMHVAAAAGVPVIEISCHPSKGAEELSNSPRRFRPWRVPSQIIQPESQSTMCRESCMMAYAHCINQIDVDQVKQVISSWLSQRQSLSTHAAVGL